ncbi:C-X-C motif chemokine 19 [Nelusetta ayraudi]|uniref:C-X-C motif chemokine 19 n=1 Tax=Nelusetta ayraudi TaxID=303726 RepID=UPI003F6FEF1D
MKLCILLLAATVIALTDGMPQINRDYNTRCHCLQVESRIIPPESLRSIKLIPEGPHCPETEVIAGLASGTKVCLNPKSSWVKKLVQFVMDKQLNERKTSSRRRHL